MRRRIKFFVAFLKSYRITPITIYASMKFLRAKSPFRGNSINVLASNLYSTGLCMNTYYIKFDYILQSYNTFNFSANYLSYHNLNTLLIFMRHRIRLRYHIGILSQIFLLHIRKITNEITLQKVIIYFITK